MIALSGVNFQYFIIYVFVKKISNLSEGEALKTELEDVFSPKKPQKLNNKLFNLTKKEKI